ncbi:H-NS family nucleoid-associated regulatory protein [Paraburkholderia hospita]|jgi:DNA-binding protein H-NS|uniref:H-NS histone family protein n=1 Tax=Paraburkholderia hospita TaxID=169430 RepID=UPI0002718BBB|nr:H-NS histone family protein [Paraburkholderia hospita]EUC16585.1 histone family protein nucleoid-structuring protein H-NS [Burkholderia sp. BT03]SKC69147.1 DNA-binding protein H-NS [Paraburkholderia hospita]SKC77461.1 DNA-binding protein H-NS [Paraburkholderia hospita]
MDERKRDSIVAYLRRRMAEVGIELDDLAAAIAQDQSQQKSAKYRSAAGEAWSGDGEMPQWLKQAISAGQSLEHFAVDGTTQSARAVRPQVDWSQDPFAGSRLSTLRPTQSHLR